MSSVGDSIRKARKDAKLTQDELAKKTNLSRSHIGAIETNRYNPSLSTLNSIAKAVNVDVSKLVGGLLGAPKEAGHFMHNACIQLKPNVAIDPPPKFYSDPETRELMEKMQNDPTHRRIFLASKDLKPDELNRIADLMETIINARKS